MILSIVDCILLHQLALKRLPPLKDQFNLDNVSIKIQYSVKVMIKANQNIFQSRTVLHCHKDVSCSIRRGIQCGSGVEKNEEEEDGRKCIYLHLESTHLGKRNSISAKLFCKINPF